MFLLYFIRLFNQSFEMRIRIMKGLSVKNKAKSKLLHTKKNTITLFQQEEEEFEEDQIKVFSRVPI